MNPNSTSRREFLHSGGSGLLALGAWPLASSQLQAGATSSVDPASPFVELAVATICTDGFSHRHHRPALALIPQTGFRHVEFNVWYPETITPAYLRELKARCGEKGLNPICLQGSSFGGTGPDGVMKDVGHKLALMYGCLELGCRRIKCTGARRGTQGGLRSVIGICRELAPAAQALGVQILLENHAGNVLERIEDYEEIFNAIDSPMIGMCLDTGHFEGVGIELSAVVDKFHSRILHVDLKDCRARGQGHDTVVFGEGVTDFDAFLPHLMSKGYSGYLVVEQAWKEPREPVLENLRSAYEKFKPYERRA